MENPSKHESNAECNYKVTKLLPFDNRNRGRVHIINIIGGIRDEHREAKSLKYLPLIGSAHLILRNRIRERDQTANDGRCDRKLYDSILIR
jgi:hypothetical protein